MCAPSLTGRLAVTGTARNAYCASSRTHSPPLIGIVTHELREDTAPALGAGSRDARARDLAPARLNLRLTYVQAISEAGGIAVVLPAHGFANDAHALLDRMDGLLFSGGPDLDPATYGHLPHPQLGPNVDRAADEYELDILAKARERDLPMLAICRGMQALNVAAKGTLHQHIPDLTDLEHRPDQPPHEAAHDVHVTRAFAAAPPHRPPPAAGQQRPPPGDRHARRRPRDHRQGARRDRGSDPRSQPARSASACSGTPSC